MAYLAPKKSLGQNFLTSIPARNAIIEAGQVKDIDHILEIGPGKGFLTQGLLTSGGSVVALEKDRELVPYLSEFFHTYVNESKLTIIEGDALTFSPKDHFKGDYKLIANIPYYITGAIISRYLSSEYQPSLMVILIQKEVAERICARDNKESILSLSVKVYGKPKLYYKVSRGSFFPSPKVDSAVLQISDISRANFASEKHEALFFDVVHAGFAHKRKMTISNLSEKFDKEMIRKIFTELSIPEKIRSEDINVTTWLAISKKLL